MARKRRNKKKQREPIFELFIDIIKMFVTIMELLLGMVFDLIFLIYEAVTIYTTGYNKKSGNGFFKTYFNKGNMGEFRLYRKLRRIGPSEDIFTNIYLPGKNTTNTELDIVLISLKGIFLYEVKNYRGFIYGSQHNEYWIQVFNRFRKHKFYNPLRQNYAHHKALETYLDIEHETIVPIISFTNKSKLNKIDIDDKTHVLQTKETIKFTKHALKNGINIFDETSLNSIRQQLNLSTLKDQATKDQHIDEVSALIGK